MRARYIRAQIIVLVCGGLVGPLSHHLLRAAQHAGFFWHRYGLDGAAEHSWMLWVGLLITVADVLVARGWPTAGRVLGQKRCSAPDRGADDGPDPGVGVKPECVSTNHR